MSGEPRPADGLDDALLRETQIDSTQVFKGRFLDVRFDHVLLPDGTTSTREYIVHSGAVMIIPILDDGRLVVERQWRYPLGRAMIEFPAGKLEPGEDTLECAVRELAEETGYRATEWAHAGFLNNAIAYSSEAIHIWFARGLHAGERHLDEGEFLEVNSASADELDALAARGAITDAKTLTGLLWLQRWRAGAWPLTWRAAP